MGVLFVESIKRLYESNKIDKQKVLKLFESKKITREELDYILNVQ